MEVSIMCGNAQMQTTSSHKVKVITCGALANQWQRLVSCFPTLFSISTMRQANLNDCTLKRYYSCGMMELRQRSFCEFRINCVDAGKYCGHPSIKYTETINPVLIEMSDQEQTMDSATIM
jgi:hypothetical protein